MASSAPSAVKAATAVVLLPLRPPPPSAGVALLVPVSVVARRRAPVRPAAALRAVGGNSAWRRWVVAASASASASASAALADDEGRLRLSPSARLTDVMSRPVEVATPGQRLAEVDAAFFAARRYSGLPVVDEEGRCVGVVSHKDSARATNGMESTVGEVMSSPPITLTLYKTVLEAATLMLKEKVHRIPVVNEQRHVIGIVTRTDVFQALEASNKA